MLVYRLYNLSILSYKCHKNLHSNNIRFSMLMHLMDCKLLNLCILMDTLDIWRFPKNIQNRKRNKMMDRTNYNLQICWHNCYMCCSQGSNYQSIKYNDLGHTLRSESILNHKLDMHHLRHKIQ